MHSLLHVSVQLEHPEGAYADPVPSAVQSVTLSHAARHSVHTLQPETHVATTLQNL
jgi:hypothetical protein